jgi:hypothetical protein
MKSLLLKKGPLKRRNDSLQLTPASSEGLQQIKTKIHKQVNEIQNQIALQILQKAIVACSSAAKKDILNESAGDQKKSYRRMTEDIVGFLNMADARQDHQKNKYD